MNVTTIHMSDIFDQCDDIYTSVMIVAMRSKQIIDERFVAIDENDEVDDSIEFEDDNEEIIEDLNKILPELE